MSQMTVLSLTIALAVGGSVLWAQKKGNTNVVQSQQMEQSGSFHVMRWAPNPLAPDPFVPQLDMDTAGSYADLALAPQFGIAQVTNSRLAVLDKWARNRQSIPLDTPVAGGTLADVPLKLDLQDPNAVPPVFFMRDADEVWQLVEYPQTEGETQFIRLRAVKDLRSDALLASAELISQFHESTTEYYYHESGALAEIIVKERSDDFEPRREMIADQ